MELSKHEDQGGDRAWRFQGDTADEFDKDKVRIKNGHWYLALVIENRRYCEAENTKQLDLVLAQRRGESRDALRLSAGHRGCEEEVAGEQISSIRPKPRKDEVQERNLENT